ncbi:hypothetical protein FQZ97_970980 [compost metagenome]
MGASMMFSSTVRCDHRLKCWNTMASLERARCSCFSSAALSMPSLALTNLSSSPATMMRPSWGRSSRFMQRRKVDLPDPEEPMMLITSPALAVTETPLSTSWLP